MDVSWGEAGAVEAASQDEAKAVLAKDGGEPWRAQGTEAWREWRGKGLGSSDAAVLLGCSPWKDAFQLYEEKLGLWKPTFGPHQRAAMARGTELEPKIRYWYEQNWRQGASFKEDVQEDAQAPHRRASFDGINREFRNPEDGSVGRIIEIKAGNMKDHVAAREAGIVPEKYMPQVQWLMMIAGVQWADYVSYGSDGTYAVVPVRADEAMQLELRERSDLFWRHVQAKAPIAEWRAWTRPMAPLSLARAEAPAERHEDTPQIGEQEVEALVAQALAAQAEANAAEARFEALKQKLKTVAGDREKTECGEAVFGWQTRKGTVDYSVIPELIGLDLDQFRKKDTRAFYFKRKAEK
jgi:putative phage-type endonuclease